MGVNWKTVVGTVAPTIATALSGPLAGLATAAVAGAFGLGDGATEEQLTAVVGKASPDHLLALKKAEQDFVLRLRELDVDIERIAMADRSSARKRETSTGDNLTPRMLALCAVLTFSGCVVFVFWLAFSSAGVDPVVMGLVGSMTGYVSAKAELVYAYYFGSSAGSEGKDHLLYKSTPRDER